MDVCAPASSKTKPLPCDDTIDEILLPSAIKYAPFVNNIFAFCPNWTMELELSLRYEPAPSNVNNALSPNIRLLYSLISR